MKTRARLFDDLRGKPLSAVEALALECAADGMTIEDTATYRRCSKETVKAQRRFILAKLGAENMPHAVAIGFRSGILE